MEASEYIGISLAILTFMGVVTALILGIRSLHQTEKIWSRQYNRALLKEIIDWDEEVAESGIPQTVYEPWDDANSWPFLASQYEKLKTKYQPLGLRGVYIDNIARIHFPDLKEAVVDVLRNLSTQIESLYKYEEWNANWAQSRESPDPAELYTMAEEVKHNNKLIYEAAVRAVEITTRQAL